MANIYLHIFSRNMSKAINCVKHLFYFYLDTLDIKV